MKLLGYTLSFIPDSHWYEFAFTLFLWALVAAIIVLVVAPLLMRLARKTRTDWDTKTLQAIRKPFFALLVVKGLSDSLSILTADRVDSKGQTIQGPLSEGAAVNMVQGLEILLILVATWLFYRFFKMVLIPLLKRTARKTETKIDDVMVPLVDKLGLVVLVVFAGSAVLNTLGIHPGVALAGMGVVGLVIAFAAQDTLSNFFAGLHLMLDRPFEVGDTILLDEKERADVLDVGLRSCKLYDRRLNTLVIMPNNRIAASKITNLTKPDNYYRVKVKVGVAYDSDPRQVRDLLFKVAQEYPHAMVDEDHPIRSRFEDYGDSALEFVLKVWIDDVNQMNNYAAELRHLIYDAFKKHNIEIPFPQRVLHYAAPQDRDSGAIPPLTPD